jgi:alpha-beta hydrolase superfamily lysophospholipase
MHRLAPSIVLRLSGLLVALCLALPATASDQLGVVVLHGKESTPAFMEPVASPLRAAGFVVEVPEMPWSRRRLYDASFSQSLSEIDHAIDRLRDKGATKVVVAGLSMGGPAVFGMGATRKGIDGVIAWAPAHDPVNDPAMRAPQFLDAVSRAQQSIERGKGDEIQTFPDINRTILSVKTTPKIWLSYWAPDGSNSMPRNAAAFPTAIPVLIVVTPRDPFPQDEEYILRKTPPHQLSQLVKVDAPHVQVPVVAMEQTIVWLRRVQAAGQ